MVDLSRRGRCYELAANHVIDSGGTLVHGTIVSFRFPAPIDHAWVELDDGQIWEPITEVIHPAERFARIFTPTELARYDRKTTLDRTLDRKHWGPWHEGANMTNIGEGPITTLEQLVEHIEYIHEYEVAPGTSEKQIRAGHRARHANGMVEHTHRGIRQGES